MSIDTSFNNEFEKQLEEAGYHWFTDHFKKSLRGFQKRITDENGTKYFITGYHWNLAKIFPEKEFIDKDTYSFEVQFTIDENEKAQGITIKFNAEFLSNDLNIPLTTLKEVEEFYEKMWNTLKPDYYFKDL